MSLISCRVVEASTASSPKNELLSSLELGFQEHRPGSTVDSVTHVPMASWEVHHQGRVLSVSSSCSQLVVAERSDQHGTLATRAPLWWVCAAFVSSEAAVAGYHNVSTSRIEFLITAHECTVTQPSGNTTVLHAGGNRALYRQGKTVPCQHQTQRTSLVMPKARSEKYAWSKCCRKTARKTRGASTTPSIPKTPRN